MCGKGKEKWLGGLMKATSLTELLNKEKEEIIEGCDLCGLCVDACPAIPLTPLASMSSFEVQEKVIDVLKNGVMSEEAGIRVASCTYCAMCVDTCPQGLDPLHLLEILQIEMVKLGQKRYPRMEIKLGDRICLISDVLASLQMKPEERRWLTGVPDNPPPKDFVVFTGCGPVMMADKMFLIADIFDRLGLDFVMVAGGELCCGGRYLSVNLERAEACNREFVHALNAFKPGTVIYVCPECYYQMTQYYAKINPPPFENEELLHFLSQNIDKLELTHPVNKIVTFHDPCSLARRIGDTESVRRLLSAVPGLKLVEMKHNRQQTMCCGAETNRTFPKVSQEMTRLCLEEVAGTGAQVLVDFCQGCLAQFYLEEPKYPFEVQNILTILGEAMGISYEDKLKKFYRSSDLDNDIAEARENIEANSYNFDHVARLAKRFFVGPSS